LHAVHRLDRGAAHDHDIAQLLAGVPTVRILSGDPAYSLSVEVAAEQVELLRRTVAESVMIGEYREFSTRI
jgi:hypothetical protein